MLFLLLAAPLDLTTLQKPPGFAVERGKATLPRRAWAFLRGDAPGDAESSLSFRIAQPVLTHGFFVESW
ncbi:MAG: hypothetical protein K2W96_18570, partial [Gemmataceae bacterium]|nr:hypothetical protein [Gemmataceae bacterium]